MRTSIVQRKKNKIELNVKNVPKLMKRERWKKFAKRPSLTDKKLSPRLKHKKSLDKRLRQRSGVKWLQLLVKESLR